MAQFYLLSVLLNILGGVALVTGSLGERLKPLQEMVGTATAKIVLGVGAAATGVLKLFVRAPGDTVPVAGDLLPALIGMAVGLALLADIFVSRKTDTEEAQKIQKAAALYRIPLAVLGVAGGVLHFLLAPTVIL